MPTVTWGTSPEDVVAITGCVPDPAREANPQRKIGMERALEYMGLAPNTRMEDIKVRRQTCVVQYQCYCCCWPCGLESIPELHAVPLAFLVAALPAT